MAELEKIIKGLECLITNEVPCEGCPYNGSGYCLRNIANDAMDLLKEQETTSTTESRLFHCEKCGYGIDDIYLSNEYDFDIYPHYCPNCGRQVKWG